MRKILKIFVLSALAAGIFSGSASADPFSDFDTYIGNSAAAAKGMLTPFAEDFGGLIGGADFNSGRALGFPGFDVGVAFTVQAKPNKNNLLLKNADVKAFGIPLLQASVGLPVAGADIALRGLTLSGLSIIGGGVRCPVLKSGALTKFIPDVSVSAFYDVISYDYFEGSHMSVDVAASFDIPVIKPFVGVGLDRTTLEIKGVSAAVNGVDAAISKPRYTMGVKFSPLPLVYVYGAYSVLHGQAGYQGGLGARF
ncbi:MAG: hypothetical protein A2285_07775 [Elusimicrobia bacterium RIFOXYA12_FULL_57_11]|nr:MAG: hypothetical protein A2285_07775 [Elusimicrobia bacterium RIFOXYA12_FULL_57_11]